MPPTIDVNRWPELLAVLRYSATVRMHTNTITLDGSNKSDIEMLYDSIYS